MTKSQFPRNDQGTMTQRSMAGSLGFGVWGLVGHWRLVIGHCPRMLAALIILAFVSGCHASKENAVVIYTSQDQVYAEPIFRSFTAETGIEVLPVFDTESVKTAGLANRLRFEKSNPQCDLFWNNEEMHTRFLERDALLQETNPWSAAGYRTRRIVINTNLVAAANAPKNLMELTNSAWRGKIVLAYPLFGTTAYQFLALRQHWGDEIWKAWCKGLAANSAKRSMVIRSS